jgi:hypothetical protein
LLDRRALESGTTGRNATGSQGDHEILPPRTKLPADARADALVGLLIPLTPLREVIPLGRRACARRAAREGRQGERSEHARIK